jgi:hypothetical protein
MADNNDGEHDEDSFLDDELEGSIYDYDSLGDGSDFSDQSDESSTWSADQDDCNFTTTSFGDAELVLGGNNALHTQPADETMPNVSAAKPIKLSTLKFLLNGRNLTENELVDALNKKAATNKHIQHLEIQDAYIPQRMKTALFQLLQCDDREWLSLSFQQCAMEAPTESLCEAIRYSVKSLNVSTSHPELYQVLSNTDSSKPTSSLTRLRCEANMIHERDVQALLTNHFSLKSSCLTTLSLKGCYFQDHAKGLLLGGIGHIEGLQTLNLSSCRLEDPFVVQLMELLMDSSTPLADSLKCLNVARNQCISMASVHAISSFMRQQTTCTSKLHNLNLRQMWKYRMERNINATPLFRALSENPSSPLRTLILAKNEIEDCDVDIIVAGFLSPSTPPRKPCLLEMLDLRANPISNDGATALLESMRTGSLSLHRIRISKGKISPCLHNELKFYTHLNWAGHHLLSAPSHRSKATEKNGNDFCVALWPLVLARVNHICDERFHEKQHISSILYSLLRSPNDDCSALPLAVSFAMMMNARRCVFKNG